MFVLDITSTRLRIYASAKKGYDENLSQILYVNLTSDEVISKKKKLTYYQKQVLSKFWDWFSEYFWIVKEDYSDCVLCFEVTDEWLNDHVFQEEIKKKKGKENERA